ncbi:DNA-3-methyladenine glycosylase 2 family protein [Streptomyces sp. S465]|nr:DNA-3-methyladenine glycosylase 2 family protein [Streptomyces sp. S465]WAP57930.1 DNA-3-methyladenine glycosylase 2 family protein [Streptomyces sp. S465]
MTTVVLTPSGPFSLAASVRFLEDFTPASYQGEADGVLRLAFPADDGHSTVAVAVRQEETAGGAAGRVRAEFTVHPGPGPGPLGDSLTGPGPGGADGAGGPGWSGRTGTFGGPGGPGGIGGANDSGPGEAGTSQADRFGQAGDTGGSDRYGETSRTGRADGSGPGRDGTGRAGEAGTGGTGDGFGRAAGPGGAVRAQLARILSLDVDGSGFPGLAAADPVVAGLMADYPGLRPVCFHSPYEAAAWAIIGHRIRMTQAAAIKARLAERHGRCVQVEGRTLYAFPTPPALRTITRAPGLTEVKIERLHALAEAADAGELDAARLRAMPVDDALAALRTLPGIGPFSAELILIRGAGHPDVFPRHEPRLHAAMANAYGLAATSSGATGSGAPSSGATRSGAPRSAASHSGDPRRLAQIADRWKPYRSWVALLLRARAARIGPS